MELKPCPFCGEIPYLERKPLWRTVGGSTHGYYNCYEYDIHCRTPECGCTVKLGQNETIYRKDEEAMQTRLMHGIVDPRDGFLRRLDIYDRIH